MDPFSIAELAGAATIMAAAVGGLLVACQKSKCSKIACCWGLIEVEREVPPADEPASDEIRAENMSRDTVNESYHQ